MSDFQILVTGNSAPENDGSGSERVDLGHTTHSKKDVVERIEALERMWPDVMQKITAIAANSEPADKESGLVLDKIEFNVGIEAGLNIGLVSKGTAAVTISFARKS